MQRGVLHTSYGALDTDKVTFESTITKYSLRQTLYCGLVAKSRYRPGSGLAGRSSPASFLPTTFLFPSFLLGQRVRGCPAAAWKKRPGVGKGGLPRRRQGTWLFARAAVGRSGTGRLSAVAVGSAGGRQQQEAMYPPPPPIHRSCGSAQIVNPPHWDFLSQSFSSSSLGDFWLSDHSAFGACAG